ncbi:MAG TPA: ceramidase domain-containing protein [Casimicrobiaceae bacterium]|nr:ceramidase domain-containing protein [Casimicrobiaceae bacterium]
MTELLFLHWRNLSRGERISLVALCIALVAWTLLPPVAQDQAYHEFADRRAWLGIARAADVLSNLAFFAVGAYGLVRLFSGDRTKLPPATEASVVCIALGFLLTAFGSAWYHLAPNDATLVWDRLPMTLAFAGVLGAAIAQRIGQNVARVALAVLFELGVVSVVYWKFSGDLSLYLLLQFGGIAALLAILFLTPRGADPFPWWWLIGWYSLSKVFELADRTVWDATGGAIAGHALKHLTAALAGAGLMRPLTSRPPPSGS